MNDAPPNADSPLEPRVPPTAAVAAGDVGDAGRAEDTGLRCPRCEYNLTGLVEDRCPECGEAFDRAELRARAAGRPAPIPYWDERDRIGVVRAFWRLSVMVCFRPGALARGFPWRYRSDSLIAYWFAVRLAAVLIGGTWFLLSMPFSGPWVPSDLVLAPLLLSVAYVLGTLVCEALLVAAFALLAKPRVRLPPRLDLSVSSSWWGVVGVHGAFLPIQTLIIGGLLFVGTVSEDGARRMAWYGLVLGPMIVWFWWWGALAVNVYLRSRGGVGSIVAVGLIPVAALIGIGTGLMSGALCAGAFS
jgi:hypothetical protein